MNKKFIREQVYRVHYSGDWQCYSANDIEEAISMCREEHPGCSVNSVEFIAHTKRRSTKTLTIDV